jgi:hypothetical protein
MRSSPVKPELTFYSPKDGKLVTFTGVEQYARKWFKLKLTKMVGSSYTRSFYEKRVEQEYDFLRTIYTNAKFERSVEGNTVLNRMYIDESHVAKRQRLMDTYGPDHYDHLLNLPISKLGPTLFFEEDELPKYKPFARERWLQDLTNLNVG